MDLVLDTRMAMLRSSLAIVQNALSQIEDTRRPENTLLDGYEKAISSLNGAVDQAVRGLREVDLAPTAVKLVNRLEEARLDCRPAESAKRELVKLGDSIEELNEAVEDRLNELAAIEAALLAAGEDEQSLNRAWSSYQKLSRSCEVVFADYVDLVRGVMLRDVGADRDLCLIADELMRQWGRIKKYVWRSVTVPAARERNGASAAGLIRLGFPEWSIWSLALAAHEFGHVFATEHTAMAEVARQSAAGRGVSEVTIRSWIADAFATSVMGPAYVCAALLLRVDPDSQEDQTRVDVILKTLDVLDPEDEHGIVRERLREGWERATARSPAEPDANVADLTEMVVRETKDLVSFFTPTEWERATELSDRLENDLFAPDADIPRQLAVDLNPSDLRTLLVAAWYARLGIGKGTRGQAGAHGDEQRRLAALAERTRLTCIEIIQASAPGGGGAVPSPPPRGTPPADRVPLNLKKLTSSRKTSSEE